jgi:hypothetical protein
VEAAVAGEMFEQAALGLVGESDIAVAEAPANEAGDLAFDGALVPAARIVTARENAPGEDGEEQAAH